MWIGRAHRAGYVLGVQYGRDAKKSYAMTWFLQEPETSGAYAAACVSRRTPLA